jgi:hypothetical protein
VTEILLCNLADCLIFVLLVVVVLVEVSVALVTVEVAAAEAVVSFRPLSIFLLERTL